MVSRKKILVLFLAVVMAFGSLLSVSAATSPTTGPTTPTTPTTPTKEEVKVSNVKNKKAKKYKNKKIKFTWSKKSGVKVKITLLKKNSKGKYKTYKTYSVKGNDGKKITKNLKKGTYKWKMQTSKTVDGKTYKSSTYSSKNSVKIK